MNVEKILVRPTYTRENGLWALDTQNVVPENTFTSTDTVKQSIVWLPSGQVAGNHKHERKEALFGIGDTAYFLWQDAEGQIHEEAMNPDSKMYLFIIPPHVPHAVINKSSAVPVILYEYFNDIQGEVEKVNLI